MITEIKPWSHQNNNSFGELSRLWEEAVVLAASAAGLQVWKQKSSRRDMHAERSSRNQATHFPDQSTSCLVENTQHSSHSSIPSSHSETTPLLDVVTVKTGSF